MKLPRWKTFITLLTCILALYVSAPNFLGSDISFLPKQKINYGLDLRGGSHLLIKVDFETYLKDQLNTVVELVRKELRKNKIGYLKLKNKTQYVSFKLKNEADFDKVKKIIKNTDRNLRIELDSGQLVKLSYSDDHIDNLQKDLIDQSREIIRMRIDESGTLDPSIQRQGKNNILLQIPGLQDPEEIKRVLGKTAKMTFHLINETPYNNIAPIGSSIMGSSNDPNYKYLVFNRVLLSGDLLNNAKAQINNGSHVVAFEFNRVGAKLFGDVTRNNPGKRLAIVLDNKVVSAPTINEPILGGSGIIQGNFTASTANELALLLRAGALPAPLKIIEERTVGPTLGQDSIELGKKASIIAIIAVVVFMVLLYGTNGVFASIALIFNLLLLIAAITILQATLTLPGIAGIVLTMGMAVDANVLIFERIAEEMKIKASRSYAIERGFSQAFATILDSNITTLIAAFFLYIFGTGVVKSFSVTLTIGILSSMFTAITLTKLIITSWFRDKN